MNTPKTDAAKIYVQIEAEHTSNKEKIYLIDREVARQLETQVQELREALLLALRYGLTTQDIEDQAPASDESALSKIRAALERTK